MTTVMLSQFIDQDYLIDFQQQECLLVLQLLDACAGRQHHLLVLLQLLLRAVAQLVLVQELHLQGCNFAV